MAERKEKRDEGRSDDKDEPDDAMNVDEPKGEAKGKKHAREEGGADEDERPTKRPRLDGELDKVQADIQKVETKIEKIEGDIEAKVKGKGGLDEKASRVLDDEIHELREEKKQLREEKRQLREEKNRLLEIQIPDATTLSKTNLWTYCHSNTVPEAGTVVTLPEGCSWLNESPDTPALPILIRRSYSDLFSIIMNLVASLKTSPFAGCVLTGSPGIGKSYFLSYVFWHFAKQGKTVVFESMANNNMWLFLPDGTVSLHDRSPQNRPNELNSRTTLYLFDPFGKETTEPIGCSAFTIVASSPNPIHYAGFQKQNGCDTTLYMPCWSAEELESIRPHSIDPKELQDRFYVFGGIPRYLFKPARAFTSAVKRLDLEMRDVDLEKLEDALGDLEKGDKISHKLIHYKVDPSTYMDATMQYASPYVHEHLPMMVPTNRLKSLGKILSEVANADVVLEGNIYETFLHRAFPGGITMEARCLEHKSASDEDASHSSNQDDEISFEKRRMQYFDNRDELSGALVARCYARPSNPNSPAIDALTWHEDEIVFLQFTRSKKHEVSMHELSLFNDLNVAKSINSQQSKFRLYFVVPLERYDEFKLQRLTVPPQMRDSTKSQYVPDIDEKVEFVNKNVEQWVARLKTWD